MGLRIMWVLFATLGVKIDEIQDNNTVNFSVPSISDYTAENVGALPINGAATGQPIAGELLLEMASKFFEDNGFTPNGRVRMEYWTKPMGEFAQMKIQTEMDE